MNVKWTICWVMGIACVAAGCSANSSSSRSPDAIAAIDPHMATVTFLWPSTSCDPGGYYTLATSDGKFLGDLESDSQLRVALPKGDYTIVGWNAARQDASSRSIAVLHAHLAEGRSYYARLAFGEWSDRGPARALSIRGEAGCIAPDHDPSSAMEILTERSKLWPDLSAWTKDLKWIAPDVAAGQAGLDEHRAVLGQRVAVAEFRFEGFQMRARRLATLEPNDGVLH